MGTDTLVEEQIEAGRKLVSLLGERGFNLTAAGWAKTLDDGRWYLYVASNRVEENGLIVAYRELNTVVRELSDAWISLDDIKLIGKDNSATSDFVDLAQRYSGSVPSLALRRLGSMTVEDIYIYPEHIARRVAFRVTYIRQGESNQWIATTEREKEYANLPFDGVASHSNPCDGYETISVLLKIDPRFDDRLRLSGNLIWVFLEDQARAIADESFKVRHPDAMIGDEPDPIVHDEDNAEREDASR